MEDGATIAVCLRKAGRENVAEAVAAFEALRYQRVKSAQKTGEQTRDIWHKADFEAAKKDPRSLRLRREAWLLNYDAEKYADDNYDVTVQVLRKSGLKDTTEARALHVPEGTHGYLEYGDHDSS
jgi:hypothetical protein